MSRPGVLAGVWLALGLSGCALFSKGEVSAPRHFSLEVPAAKPAAGVTASKLELRLGRVTAGSCLEERIMFRQSAFEVGFYDERLWSEQPEATLRRSLTRVLFEERQLRRVVRGAAPTLDVELVGFEEVLSPVHLGRVTIAFTISDERVVSLQQTLTFERPVAASTSQTEGSAVAEAMGEALRDAVHEVSSRVVAELTAAAEPPVAAAP